jgi:hypothetical protein
MKSRRTELAYQQTIVEPTNNFNHGYAPPADPEASLDSVRKVAVCQLRLQPQVRPTNRF